MQETHEARTIHFIHFFVKKTGFDAPKRRKIGFCTATKEIKMDGFAAEKSKKVVSKNENWVFAAAESEKVVFEATKN